MTTTGAAPIASPAFTGLPAVGPIPTGTAAKDTAAVQAVLNAAASAGTVAMLTQPGTFVYNAKIVVKGSAIWGGPTQTHQAGASFPTATTLVVAATQTAGRVTWSGSPVFDSNGIAAHAFAHNGTAKLLLLGQPTYRNSAKTDAVIAGPFQALLGMRFYRATGSHPQPKGYASLTVTATDVVIAGANGSGQETGIWNQGADNTFIAPHFSNTKILQGYSDTAGSSHWIDPIADSYVNVTHTATGSTASAVITDATVKAIHQGIRVTGTNIPATSFIGAVTTGTSFTLVNKNNVSVNPTGAVSSITLIATWWNLRGSGGGQIIGGLSEAAHTPSSAGDCFNMGHSVSTTTPYVIIGHKLTVHAPLTFTNTFTGSSTRAQWWGLIQSGVTHPVTTTSVHPASPSSVYVDGYTANITTTSTTLVMAGLGKVTTHFGYTGFAFTPTKTGNVRIRLTGLVTSKVALKTVTLQGYFGTGAAPTKGAATTGNAFVVQGAVSTRGVTAGTAPNNEFALVHLAKTLTLNAKYWIDLAFKTATAADAALISNLVVEVDEITAAAQ